MSQDFYSYFDIKDAARKRTNAAYEFLSTGVILGTLGGSKCYGSEDCGSGWGCVNNQCVYLSQANTDSLCGIGPSGSGGCGGDSGCGTSTPGTSCLAADCCGTRCCRFESGGNGILNVNCFCGECQEEERECNNFCDSYYKNGGVLGEGCSSSVVCSECSYCSSSGRCAISNTGPCWCLSSLPNCTLCTESGAVVDNQACWPCRDFTKCGEPTGERYCSPGLGGSLNLLQSVNGRPIDAPCDPTPKCEPICYTRTVDVNGQGSVDTPASTLYPNCCPTCECTNQGFITADYGDGSFLTVYFIKECDSQTLPADCFTTDCRCHSDCPSCFKCSNGTCVADPGCPATT